MLSAMSIRKLRYARFREIYNLTDMRELIITTTNVISVSFGDYVLRVGYTTRMVFMSNRI